MWEETFDITRQAGNDSLPNGGFDPALLQVMCVLTADESEFENMKSARKPPTPIITLAIASVLSKALLNRQGEYSTTIAQDISLLQTLGIQGRYRAAIEVRLGEKEIISAASQYLAEKTTALSLEPDISKKPEGKSASDGNNHSAKRRRMQ